MDQDSSKSKEAAGDKKDSYYSLEEAVNVQVLQKLQDDYAKLTGLSIWLLDEDVRVTKRSLSHFFINENRDELLPMIDELIAKDENMPLSFEYKGQNLLIYKFFILYKDKILGKCILLDIVSEFNKINESQLQEKALFFSQIIQRVLESRIQFLLTNDKLQKIMETEKYVEAENQRLQKENDYDMLTKVHSRAYFDRCMNEMNAREDLLPISLVVGDVNNLKFTNDMFGHRHGDWLLQIVAKIMQEEAAEDYVVARCGGDEFMVILPRSNRAAANYYCYRVTERLKLESSCCLMPSISLGTAKKSEMNQDLHRLMEIADVKMYAAKGEFKQHQDYFEEMMQVSYARGFVTSWTVEERISMMGRFADYLGWSKTMKEQSVLLIHYQDLGLCIVPQHIYLKKEELTDREWREVKKHPQIGAKLALVRPDTTQISELIKETHENWDGSGWPRNLAGTKVDIRVYAARIVTEYLNYREKKGKQEAIRHIEKHAGTIYHPELALKFAEFIKLENKDKGELIDEHNKIIE